MAHKLQIPVVRALGWFMRKIFRQLYSGIHVDETHIEAVRIKKDKQ